MQLEPFRKTAIISIGVNEQTLFQQELSKWYVYSDLFVVGKNMPADQLKALLETLKQYEQVFISINDTRPRPASKLDYSIDVRSFITELEQHRNIVTTVFANAYTTAGLPGIDKKRGATGLLPDDR